MGLTGNENILHPRQSQELLAVGVHLHGVGSGIIANIETGESAERTDAGFRITMKKYSIHLLLSKIALKEIRFRCFEFANSLFLDLAHALTGKVKLFADFFESHFLTTDSEEKLDD